MQRHCVEGKNVKLRWDSIIISDKSWTNFGRESAKKESSRLENQSRMKWKSLTIANSKHQRPSWLIVKSSTRCSPHSAADLIFSSRTYSSTRLIFTCLSYYFRCLSSSLWWVMRELPASVWGARRTSTRFASRGNCFTARVTSHQSLGHFLFHPSPESQIFLSFSASRLVRLCFDVDRSVLEKNCYALKRQPTPRRKTRS